MKKLTNKRVEELLDEIKDEVDRLHEISGEKRRESAARELIEYIILHHNLPGY